MHNMHCIYFEKSKFVVAKDYKIFMLWVLWTTCKDHSLHYKMMDAKYQETKNHKAMAKDHIAMAQKCNALAKDRH